MELYRGRFFPVQFFMYSLRRIRRAAMCVASRSMSKLVEEERMLELTRY